MDKRLEAVGRLLDIMDELREKCPWDRKQTFDSLRMNTIEETYELADAILDHDLNEIRKELGDLLLHVVDAAGSEGRDPVEDFHIIQNELEQYGEPVGRPQLVVLNKCDLMPEKEKQQELVAKFKELGYEAFPVSAATRQGFDKLLDRVVQLLPELPPPRVFMEEEEEEEPSITDMSFTVTQQKGGVFVVEGPAIQRLIDSVNFEDEESMNWFHRQLRDRGIIDELRKKGAKEGSPVQLGDMEFDFIE